MFQNCLKVVVWPKLLKVIEERSETSEIVCVHELAKTEYEEWLQHMGSGEMESRPSSIKFKFTQEAKRAYAFVMAQVCCCLVACCIHGRTGR